MKLTKPMKYGVAAAAAVVAAVAAAAIAIGCLAGDSAAPTIQYTAGAMPMETIDLEAAAESTETEAANPVQSSDWRLTLVNKENPIPEGYEAQLMTLSNGKQVDERMYPDLQEMFDAMRAASIYPTVREGYRTDEEQKAAMEAQINTYIDEGHSEEEAKEMAAAYVALPGCSEHQLGLAVDINADTNYTENETVYTWLAENAAAYGFILRYPEGKESLTGFSYEPWHYRYVGKEAAKEITEAGLCLEEYLTPEAGTE